MDPVITDLATKIMAVLVPYVAIGAEEFARNVGSSTFEKAKAIVSTLKERWTGDKEATESLVRFEEKPKRYQSVLADILQDKLTEDKDLAAQLTQLLQEMGPMLEIVQQMKEAENITGLRAREMIGGRARIMQEIEKGKDVTGAELDTLG